LAGAAGRGERGRITLNIGATVLVAALAAGADLALASVLGR
jgi:hypothetical protein